MLKSLVDIDILGINQHT